MQPAAGSTSTLDSVASAPLASRRFYSHGHRFPKRRRVLHRYSGWLIPARLLYPLSRWSCQLYRHPGTGRTAVCSDSPTLHTGSPIPRTTNQTDSPMTPNPLRGFSVRRTPRACHGGCDRLRPGSLRASHAVCLRCPTLEPARCARNETDNESVSTSESILAESLFMRGDYFDIPTVPFGFYSTSRHCIPRLSPRNSNSEETPNNGAAENCSARHGSCYSYSGVSRSSHLLS